MHHGNLPLTIQVTMETCNSEDDNLLRMQAAFEL
jgi:hypothetical protein